MNEVMEMPAPEAGALADVRQQPTGRQLSVVEYAVQSGAPVAEVRALVELQIRMDEHKLAMRKLEDERERELRLEAGRTAFADAMAEFKKNPPTIYKDKHVYFKTLKGETSYDHATIGEVCDKIISALAEHGFSHRWEPGSDGGRQVITCIITHRLGHSQSTRLEGPADESGNKNPLQAQQSTRTYLERHSLLLACGLATRDMPDDDGAGSSAGADGTKALAEKWRDRVGRAKNDDELTAVWNEAVVEINAADDRLAKDTLRGAIVRRRAELAKVQP